MNMKTRSIIIVFVLSVTLFTVLGVRYLSPRNALAIPIGQRTVGLQIDSSGWRALPSPAPINPLITIYDDTNVTMFLRSNDNHHHQMQINLPTPVTSPLMTSNGQIVKFSFVARPAQHYTYCDTYTNSCGVFQVKIYGDINGDDKVDNYDYIVVRNFFGVSLNTTLNGADNPYADGRVDMTDYIIVLFYFGTTGPWPAPYHPDINGDGVVDINDVSIVSANMGSTALTPFNDPNQGPDLNYDNAVTIIDVGGVAAHLGCTLSNPNCT